MKMRLPVLVIFAGFLSFCNPYNKEKIPMDNFQFTYDLDHPERRYKLPDYLEEISGLSYYGKGKIACIQDEKAHIYIWNLEQEKITKKYDFGDDADYEDISVVGSTAYILRNNGSIYRIKNFQSCPFKIGPSISSSSASCPTHSGSSTRVSVSSRSSCLCTRPGACTSRDGPPRG